MERGIHDSSVLRVNSGVASAGTHPSREHTLLTFVSTIKPSSPLHHNRQGHRRNSARGHKSSWHWNPPHRPKDYSVCIRMLQTKGILWWETCVHRMDMIIILTCQRLPTEPIEQLWVPHQAASSASLTWKSYFSWEQWNYLTLLDPILVLIECLNFYAKSICATIEASMLNTA